MRGLIALLVVLVASAANAETVFVKYRGMVDLKPFACTNTVSSLVKRVCYDQRNRYMLIDLNGTFYHYCGIDGGSLSALLNADSKGRFFNAAIKGRFDCRLGGIPAY